MIYYQHIATISLFSIGEQHSIVGICSNLLKKLPIDGH